MSQSNVTHTLIKHESGNLELRTSVRLAEVHNQSTMLDERLTVADLRDIMRINRQGLADHVGRQLVGTEL